MMVLCLFSELLSQTVQCCLQPSPKDRADILQVCSLIAPLLVKALDRSEASLSRKEKELEKEKRMRQKHFTEANRNLENYQRLFQASQPKGSERFVLSV